METFGIDFENRKEANEVITDDGSVTLAWEKSDSTPVVVEQATGIDFSDAFTVYEGTDPASFVSGLPEGAHFFRVREAGANGVWSEPYEVRVEFVPRWQLMLLLSIGGIVVLSTVGVIMAGFLETSQEGGIS